MIRNRLLRLNSISKTLAVAFVLCCIITGYSQSEALRLNHYFQTTLLDILLTQFNIYSFIHLFRIPLFIVVAQKWFGIGKMNEFIITRFLSRKSFYLRKIRDALSFAVIYHCIELMICAAIFYISLKGDIGIAFSPHLSKPIQFYFGIDTESLAEMIGIVLFINIIIVFLYYFFAQIVIICSLRFSRSPVVTGIPYLLDFILLVLVKADFWFDKSLVRFILPHRNYALAYIFNRQMAASPMSKLIWPTVYWLFVIIAISRIFIRVTKHKDFIFPSETADREIGY